MKTRTKKLLCLLLALTLILGMLPGAALAAEDSTESGPLLVSADDCTLIGSYMEDYDVYLYEKKIPAGTRQVTFTDYAADGTNIMRPHGSWPYDEATNTSSFSVLRLYTAEEAMEDDSLELFDDYADYPFENVFAYLVDADWEYTVYFIVYELEPLPTDFDLDFTVTAGDTVVTKSDAELVENGYGYLNMMGDAVEGYVDAYVVTVPYGTETVTLTFNEDRLVYNYTADGGYLGGYYADVTQGDLTVEVPVDCGSSYTQADGEPDYIQVQVPYDAFDRTVLLYAITFRIADPGSLIVRAENCTEIGTYLDEYPVYLFNGEVPAGTEKAIFADFAREGSSVMRPHGNWPYYENTNTAPFSVLSLYTAEESEDDDYLELFADYEDFDFENTFAFWLVDEDWMEHAVYFIVYELEPLPTDFDLDFTVTAGNTVVTREGAELVENGYGYLDMMGEEIEGYVDAYVVTVPYGTETVTLTFHEERLVYNYTADGGYLGGYYADATQGDLTVEVPVDCGSSYTPADGEPDYIQVQVPYDVFDRTVLLYAITFRIADPASLIVQAGNCTEIGTYLDEYPVYLFNGEVPAGTEKAIFADFASEGSSVMRPHGNWPYYEDTNAAPFSVLSLYTAEEAEDDDYLELFADYEDFDFENTFAFWLVDEDWEEHAVYFIVYELEPLPTDFDLNFTVTAGDAVVTKSEAELVENGYGYLDMMGEEIEGYVDAYVVTVPQGTETVTLTFNEERLVYNYSADGGYLGGYYADATQGDLTAEVPVDCGSSYTPADGEPDYIQVQVPYDAFDRTVLLYAITFRYDGGETPEPEDPVAAQTAAELRDAIAARLASADFASDMQAPWLTADMMAYLAAFPEAGIELSAEQLQALTDAAIAAVASSTSASEVGKNTIALAAMGYDPTQLTTAGGESLNAREKLDSLCFNGDTLISTNVYSLPYLMIAYQQFRDADEALAVMADKAVKLKASWLDTEWGTDALTPFMLALAPYADNADVAAALEEALEALKAYQSADGSLGNAASTGLGLAGLVAMGVDPAEVKSAEGKSLVDGILTFASSSGDSVGSNSFDLEQGFRGLVALGNEPGYRIYDFKDKAVNPAAASPKAVVFEVIPEEAAVTVTDSQGNTVESGGSSTYRDLPAGTYSYVASLEGYEDKTGEFTVTAEAGVQTIHVSLLLSEPEEDEDSITVTVYILIHDGDTCENKLTYKNDSDKYFSLLRGESYEAFLESGATARDALLAALEDSGVDYVEDSKGYFSTIGGLEGAGHGQLSGWMYLVDGESPVIAANAYFFDGDAEMIWYFTDDYTGEYGSEDFMDDIEAGNETSETVIRPETERSEAGAAEAAATEEEIRNALDAADTESAEEIVIAPEEVAEVGCITVTVPQQGVAALADSDADLRIVTEMAEVVLDEEALSALNDTVAENLSIIVKEEDGVTVIELQADGEPVDEDIELLVRLPAEDAAPGSVLILVAEDGTEEVVQKSAGVDGLMQAKLSGSVTLKVEDRSLSFDDTEDHWAKSAGDFVSARGLMIGMDDGVFGPEESMTRAMFAAVLYRLEGAPAAGTENPFGDVPEDAWYRDAVVWAAGAGIVYGTGDGFDPAGAITREQIAVMLCRYAAYLGMDVSASDELSSFPDGDDASSWAKDAMSWAVKNGLVQGRDDGTLDPAGTATRAEVATLLQRMIEFLVK